MTRPSALLSMMPLEYRKMNESARADKPKVSRRHCSILAVAALLAITVQIALHYRIGVWPTDASGASMSAALGLLHGRGLTVAPAEAHLTWDRPGPAGLGGNLMELYDPSARRVPMYSPLPGVALLAAASGRMTGQIRYNWLIGLQIVLHVGLGLCFARELMRRNAAWGAAAGAAWLLFVPAYRLALPPTYDAWTGLASIALTTASLWYVRRRHWPSVAAMGVAAAAGIWVREYYIVLPVLTALLLIYPVRARFVHGAAFAAMVVAATVGLATVRGAGSGVNQPLVRDSVWHTFWAGVGQFENPLGLREDDDTVRVMAERISGERFRGFFWQHHPQYEPVLARLGQPYVQEHRWGLVRNALWRCTWLVAPGFAPSKTAGTLAPGRRALVLIPGLVSAGLALLAALGLAKLWRRRPADAALLIVPLVALLPLVVYYVKAKVVMLVYYTVLSLVAYQVLEWRRARVTETDR